MDEKAPGWARLCGLVVAVTVTWTIVILVVVGCVRLVKWVLG